LACFFFIRLFIAQFLGSAYLYLYLGRCFIVVARFSSTATRCTGFYRVSLQSDVFDSGRVEGINFDVFLFDWFGRRKRHPHPGGLAFLFSFFRPIPSNCFLFFGPNCLMAARFAALFAGWSGSFA